MNKELIKKWLEAVGIDEVLKDPQALMLIGGARKWAKGNKVGLEFEKEEVIAKIAEMQAKKTAIDTRLDRLSTVKVEEVIKAVV